MIGDWATTLNTTKTGTNTSIENLVTHIYNISIYASIAQRPQYLWFTILQTSGIETFKPQSATKWYVRGGGERGIFMQKYLLLEWFLWKRLTIAEPADFVRLRFLLFLHDFLPGIFLVSSLLFAPLPISDEKSGLYCLRKVEKRVLNVPQVWTYFFLDVSYSINPRFLVGKV
jgi:hypothetical protein